MRISGWSSYVCSADLAFYHAPVTDHAKTVLREWRRLNCHPTSPKPPIIIAQVCGSGMTLIGPSRTCWTERKSVVEGKGGSVRVDIGGGRIITKKTSNKKIRSTYIKNKT